MSKWLGFGLLDGLSGSGLGWDYFAPLRGHSFPAESRGPSGVRAAKRAAVKRKNKARAKR